LHEKEETKEGKWKCTVRLQFCSEWRQLERKS